MSIAKPHLGSAVGPAPTRSVVDVQGRRIPMTEDEVRATAGAVARGHDALGDPAEPAARNAPAPVNPRMGTARPHPSRTARSPGPARSGRPPRAVV